MSVQELSKYSLLFVLGYAAAALGLIGIGLFVVALVLCFVPYYPDIKRLWDDIRGADSNNGNTSGKAQ